MIDKKVIETLGENVGKKVRVEYVWYGKPVTDEGILQKVDVYGGVSFPNIGIRFVGPNVVIQKIVGEDGRVLYENPSVLRGGNPSDDEEVDEIIDQSFTEEIATEFRKKREEEYKLLTL